MSLLGRAFCFLHAKGHNWSNWSVVPSSGAAPRNTAGRSCLRCGKQEQYTNVNRTCPLCEHPTATHYGWENTKWKCQRCGAGPRRDTWTIDHDEWYDN